MLIWIDDELNGDMCYVCNVLCFDVLLVLVVYFLGFCDVFGCVV